MNREEIVKAAFLRLETTNISRVSPGDLPKNPTRLHIENDAIVCIYPNGAWAHLALYTGEEGNTSLWVQGFHTGNIRLYEQAGLLSKQEFAEIETYLSAHYGKLQALHTAQNLKDYLKRFPELKSEILTILEQAP